MQYKWLNVNSYACKDRGHWMGACFTHDTTHNPHVAHHATHMVITLYFYGKLVQLSLECW